MVVLIVSVPGLAVSGGIMRRILHSCMTSPPPPQLSALLYEEVANTDELRAALLSGALPEFGASIVGSTWQY